jgi:hypothetical protein
MLDIDRKRVILREPLSTVTAPVVLNGTMQPPNF